MSTVGFVGLGKMGAVMAPRFLDAGHELTVWNRTVGKCTSIAERGASAAACPADVTNSSEVVISILGDDASVSEVYLGEQGLFTGDAEGTLFIDMSTVRPSTSKRISEHAIEAGIEFIEAPVSGTVAPAADGKLFGLVGGEDVAVKKAQPFLDVLCRRTVHVGPVGQGALMKLVVNLPLGVYWQALAEAVALGEAGGLDRKLILETITDSSAALAVLGLKTPAILGEPGAVAFDVDSMQKDILAMIETGSGHGVPLPAASSALMSYSAASAGGMGEEDAVAIVRFLSDKMTRQKTQT
ncbi:MAG: NAD-binding protein [Alphaproteobacteria bacterium]|nr:NAD-binding protein [Alphaproteobacteria bacterium]